MAKGPEKPTNQPFLARWSQRKSEAREAAPAAAPQDEVIDTPMPELPPVDELTPQSDFSAFMHPKVDADVRRAALRKLFSDPHFNVMDGLDTYIADYSQPDPLPAGMLAGLRQAQNIIAWAKETPEETAARFEPSPSSASVPPPAESTGLISADTALQQTPSPVTGDQQLKAALVPEDEPARTELDADPRKS
jgi:hypothetical protein